ncbi:MAG TPA: succinate dehydrogenase cytochrome b subunit [Gemmatimonadaceae bacterium]|nr:succinate dehydrogenase cytochrome b subunit [Gemmatimonadaceae bacterium]
MNRALRFYSTAIGKKVVMGVTGLIGIGFVIGHMAGNLLAFRGPAAINAYAAFLQSTGELLWIVRLVLIASVILHVVAAIQLTRQNRAARPIGYVDREPQVSTWAARTMRWGGALLLLFIVLHIMHFTTGSWEPSGQFSETDVYSNLVTSFRIWWVTLFYVAAMLALGLHLYHGAWSSVRSLGISRRSPAPLHRTVAFAVAGLVWIGFTAVPLAIFAGIIA